MFLHCPIVEKSGDLFRWWIGNVNMKSWTPSSRVNSRWTTWVNARVNKHVNLVVRVRVTIFWTCAGLFDVTWSSEVKSSVCKQRITWNLGFWQIGEMWRLAWCRVVLVANNAMYYCSSPTQSPESLSQSCQHSIDSWLLDQIMSLLKWVCLTRRFTKVCLAGKRIEDLLEASSEALVIQPQHLIVWSSLRNNPNWATQTGGVDLESFQFRKESLSTN